MDTVSSKDILGFFLDWLRQNHLSKTEKCLLEEIEYVEPTPNAGAMDDDSCNSESCETNDNEVDLQVLPEKDQTEDPPLEVPDEYLPEKLQTVLTKDPISLVQSQLPLTHTPTAAPLKAVAASHHAYHGLPPQISPVQPRPLAVMEEDDDEWADPDDLGFIRVPAQPGDEIYRIIDHDDPSRASYPYLQPGVGEEVGPLPHGYHPPQYQQHYAQFSSVPYYAVAPTEEVPSDANITSSGENLGGRTSPEGQADSAGSGSGSVEDSSEPTEAAEALATKLELSASNSAVIPESTGTAESAGNQQVPPLPLPTSVPYEPRAYPLEVEQYPASGQVTAVPQSPSYPPGKPPMFFDSFELKVVYQANRTGFEEHKDFPIRMHSIIAGRYQVLEFLGSAAFSRAIQCVDLKTGQLVCIKIIRNNKDFFDQSLDEIKLLQYINASGDADENCVLQLYDYFYHKEHLFLVCELLRDNLYEFSKYNRESGDEPYFTLARLQKITRQVLTALKYIHQLNLMHCDLKPENILIKSYSRCEVKVIDFGSSCFTSDHLSSYVQSRCYRAPEVVLGLPYGQKIDLWSLGGILAELYSGRVLFHNDSINAMIARIVAICGNFPPHLLRQARYTHKFFTPRGVLYDRDRQTGQVFYLYPKRTNLLHRIGTSDTHFLNFINCLLQLDPERRPTAEEALQHPFLFHDYGPIS